MVPILVAKLNPEKRQPRAARSAWEPLDLQDGCRLPGRSDVVCNAARPQVASPRAIESCP